METLKRNPATHTVSQVLGGSSAKTIGNWVLTTSAAGAFQLANQETAADVIKFRADGT